MNFSDRFLKFEIRFLINYFRLVNNFGLAEGRGVEEKFHKENFRVQSEMRILVKIWFRVKKIL